MKVGITEKRLANKRFRRSEEAILRAFFDGDNYISIDRMAAKAGVARSTIYHHHRAVREILPDYEKYILWQYRRMIKKVLQNERLNMNMICLKILVFVLSNKWIFEILVRGGDGRIFERMLLEIRADLEKMMRLPKNSGILFAVYKSEIARLMCEWGARGFNERELEKVRTEMAYLTETARARLKILMD